MYLYKIIVIAVIFFSSLAFADAVNWQIGLQEAVTPIMERYNTFHNQLLVMCFGISILVFFLLLYVCVRYYRKNNPIPSKTSHNTLIEVVWTLIPVLILIVMAVPSMRILYFVDNDVKADLTIKVVGRQWYWQYEYPKHEINFDSYIVQDADLQEDQLRLLEVDNRIVVPVNKVVKILTTAGDVIHSWAVPAFGIKEDCIPGRTNEAWFKVTKEGVYRGQCSELCGVNHGFMPIVVEVVSEDAYAKWLEEAKEKYASNKNNKFVFNKEITKGKK